MQLAVSDFTYDSIMLHYQESASDVSVANMKTAITKIEVQVDNVTQQEYSATQLFDIMAHLGYAETAGYLRLPLGLMRLPDPAVAEALSWGTANLNSFTLKVTLASGRTAPTLAAYVRGRAEARPLGKILIVEPLTLTPPASNAYHRLLNQENNSRPLLAFIGRTSQMTKVRYKIGQQIVMDETPIAVLDEWYKDHDRLSNVSGAAIVNFASNGQIGKDVVPIVADGVPLVNQSAEFFMSGTTSYEASLLLIGEART